MTIPPFVIDVKNLNKTFGDKHVVCDVSLQVKKGEVFGFLGPNGSGKTTTIRMLCGLLTPNTGEGHCLGYHIVDESILIKAHVGYMTQKFSLYEDLTVYENLDFIGRLYKITKRKLRIFAVMEQLEFSSRKNQLAGTLSGGWKQRLALACCLLHQPKLLLLDEPTAGVDPKARREFWDQIHHLSQQGVTTLVSTHYMDEAERCTRLAYIAYGHLLSTGSMQDIIDHAKLHTWSVTGENLAGLAEKIRLLPGIEQVTFFGAKLHVSGKEKALILQSIQPFQTDTWHWLQEMPSLEDVFISLVGKSPL